LKMLYGVSPIGLGHASRAVAVGEQLKDRGVDPVFATGGPAARFVSSYGFRVRDVITEPVPRVVSGEMKDASLWYLRYWLGYRRSKRRMSQLASEIVPEVIVGDEEFSGLEVAKMNGIKHAMITDELELGFARSWVARRIEGRVERWYKELMRSMELVIVPEEGEESGNMRRVGPIVRKPTKSRKETISELSLREGESIVLLSLSGAGIGAELIPATVKAVGELRGSVLIVTGNTGPRVEAENVRDLGLVKENQNLVAAADLVISTAGKSVIDEALSFGTPIIAIPTKNHAEQERNALSLGYVPEDACRLAELVPEKVGRRKTPRAFAGAEKTAELLLKLGT